MADEGRFIWYDLYTSDLAAATRFYGAVVGWTIEDSGMPGSEKYSILKVPGGNAMGVGGLMGPRPGMESVPPFWGGYLYTKDVDGSARRLESLGGTLHRGPMEIPLVGRFAVVSDPQGGAFYLFAPDGEGELKDEAKPGYIGWRELHTTDPKGALAFYSELAGWKKEKDFDMGPHGTYTLWNAKDGQRGGLMRGQHPHTSWMFYFNVESVEKGAALVKQHGGECLTSPMQEPEGGFIVHCKDPQGATFGLCGGK